MKKVQIIISFLSLVTCFSNAQTLSAKKFQHQLENERGILIDVRTQEEYQKERLKNAININVNDAAFVSNINKLDKQKSYFLYCGIGKRSAKAAAIMKENGFLHVYDLEKGLDEWKAKGFPTEIPEKQNEYEHY